MPARLARASGSSGRSALVRRAFRAASGSDGSSGLPVFGPAGFPGLRGLSRLQAFRPGSAAGRPRRAGRAPPGRRPVRWPRACGPRSGRRRAPSRSRAAAAPPPARCGRSGIPGAPPPRRPPHGDWPSRPARWDGAAGRRTAGSRVARHRAATPPRCARSPRCPVGAPRRAIRAADTLPYPNDSSSSNWCSITGLVTVGALPRVAARTGRRSAGVPRRARRAPRARRASLARSAFAALTRMSLTCSAARACIIAGCMACPRSWAGDPGPTPLRLAVRGAAPHRADALSPRPERRLGLPGNSQD